LAFVFDSVDFVTTITFPANLKPQNTKAPTPIFKNPEDCKKRNGNLKDDFRAMENALAKSIVFSPKKPIYGTAYSLQNTMLRFYPRIFRVIQAQG